MSCESIAKDGRRSFSQTKHSDKHSPASDIHFDYTQNSQPLSQYMLNMCITYIHIQSITHTLTCQICIQTLASYHGMLQYFTHNIQFILQTIYCTFLYIPHPVTYVNPFIKTYTTGHC